MALWFSQESWPSEQTSLGAHLPSAGSTGWLIFPVQDPQVGEAVNLNKPVRQAKKSSEGFELKHSYYAQETY